MIKFDINIKYTHFALGGVGVTNFTKYFNSVPKHVLIEQKVSMVPWIAHNYPHLLAYRVGISLRARKYICKVTTLRLFSMHV